MRCWSRSPKVWEPAFLPMGRCSPGTTEWRASSAISSLIPMARVAGAGRTDAGKLFSSCRAALRYYRELQPKGPLVAFQELLNLAEEGDAAAAQALTKQAMWIGRGLRMIIASVSPSTILIAGDLTSAWHRFGPVIEKEVTDLTLAGSSPLIRPSHEGEIARLRGAAALVFQRGARRTTSTPATAAHQQVCLTPVTRTEDQAIKIASRSISQHSKNIICGGQLCVYS